jgi:hypothetical protein
MTPRGAARWHIGPNSTLRLDVNLFNERQPFAARIGQPDDLFEPGSARRFDVQTGVMFFDQPVDNGVDGKLVAAGMDAEL